MKTTPIWDSTTRYRSFRLEDAERQPADRFGPAYTPQRLRLTYNDPQSDGNWRLVMADIEGVEFAPVFLHYKEPLTNELRGYQLLDWVPVWVATIALRFLPGPGGPEPEHGADLGVRPFDPTDSPESPAPEFKPLPRPQPYPFQHPRPIAADPVPPVVVTVDTKPGRTGGVDTGQPLPYLGDLPPGEYQADIRPNEQDPGNPNLFRVAEVRTLNGQPVQAVTWGSDLGMTSEEVLQNAAAATQHFPDMSAHTVVLPKAEDPRYEA